MGRQQQIIDRLVDENLVDGETADELSSSRADDAAAALLVDTDVDENTLLQHLALCFDLPPAGYLDGLFVERHLLERLDAEIIREYEVLPVRQRGDEGIDVLTVEPLNELALEVLQEKLELPVRQYIWPRLRMLQALHFYLGDELPGWMRSYLRDHPVSMGYATVDGDIDVGEALKTSGSLHVLQWARRDVQEFIESCFDRDTLLKVLLGYAGHWLTSRLIVVFGKQGVQPYFVEDWPKLESSYEDVEQLRKICVETSTQSLRKDSWTSGEVEKLGLSPLFDALGIEAPSFLVALPVHIGSRPAMSIIGVPADRDAALRLDDRFMEYFDVEGLEKAALWVGNQLQTMIKLAKKDALPPPADRVPSLPRPDRQFGLGVEESLIEQTIARRKNKDTQRHRWEIVDISEVVDDSAAEEESPAPDDSEKDSSPDVAATSFGMPTLSEDDSEELINGTGPFDKSSDKIPQSEPEDSTTKVADSPQRTKDDDNTEMGAEESDSILPGSTSGANGGVLKEGDSPPAHQVTPFPPGGPDQDSDPKPVVDTTPTSDALVADSESDEDNDSSRKEAPTTNDSFSSNDSTPSLKTKYSLENADEPTLEEPSASAKLETEDNSGEEADKPEIDEEVEAAKGPTGLQIPTDRSGFPMAQILRRPKRKSSAGDESSETEDCDSSANDEGDNFDDAESITGRTIDGVGEIRPIAEDSTPDEDSAASEESQEISAAQSLETRSESRTGSTVQLGGNSSSTQSFGELIEDMAPDLSSSSPSAFEHRPQTIPVDVIEEISEAGPVAVEIEQSLTLIEDGDPKKAFAAAEHLATAGAQVLPALKSLFPGRLFVDRYQYTADTLPPVNEHGPVMEALVRIGTPSLEIAASFLDHSSPEYRFYATFLLTELPATPLLAKLREQLFDRDRQTRLVARKIVIAHRHVDHFESTILTPLRSIVEEGKEDFRVEIATEILRHFKDVAAIPLFIEALEGATDHLRKTLHRALQEITYQRLVPSPTEWRRWWQNQEDDKRWKWLVQAMNNDDYDIRMMAFDEIEQIPGLELDYHPDQPKKLRARAQQELSEFFKRHDQA